MDPNSIKALAGAAGSGSSKKLYVDEVFAVTSWVGTGSAQTITTGINISDGGFFFIKNRTDSGTSFLVYDTERDLNYLKLNDSIPSEQTETQFVTAVSGTGFTTGTSNSTAGSAGDMMSCWTFAKAPGFLDVVKYDGNGTNQQIAHELDAAVGMMWIKRLDGGDEWYIYHKDTPADNYFEFKDDAIKSSSTVFNNTAPTSTHFSVGAHDGTNHGSGQYIAYIFANNAGAFGENENQAIIQMGKFTASNTWTYSAYPGWEPQLFLTWRQAASSKFLIDQWTGGLTRKDGGLHSYFELDTNNPAYTNNNDAVQLLNTGLQWDPGYGWIPDDAGNDNNMYWMCIRAPDKSVGKPAELASEVFDITTGAGTSSSVIPKMQMTMRPDYAMQKATASASDKWYDGTRIANHIYLPRPKSEGAGVNTAWEFGYNKGWMAHDSYTNWTDSNSKSWAWKRNPDTFGLAYWTGTNNAITITNPLKTAPEMIWARQTTNGSGYSNVDWYVYHKNTHTDSPGGYYVRLDETTERTSDSTLWNNTTPSDASFAVAGNLTSNGKHYVGMCFASMTGISKLGGFTWTTASGSGDIDCGFTVRYLLIKCVSAGSSWLMMDSDKGFAASGNSDFLRPNSTASYGSSGSYIIARQITNGFKVPSTQNWQNTNNEEWIYFAHA